ncbi:unnamed protein product [Sphagnum balticum]
MDKNYIYHYLNPTYEKWFGIRAEDCIGKHTSEIVGKEAFEARKIPLTNVLKGQVQCFDGVMKTVSGEVKSVLSTYTPDFAPNGEVVGFFAVVHDITQIKEMELAAKNRETQLVSSSKMSSLGEMAGGIAHEINNPLAIIVGQLDRMHGLMENTEIDRNLFKELIRKTEATAFRISKIIKGLRSFSRNSENDPMNQVKVSQLVEDTLELCRERFKAHDIELKVSVADDLVIECRATQICQILMNLLNNAHDAVTGLEERWVELSVAAEGSKNIRFSVTDSGNGISPEVVNKLMQPFFTTKEVGKGTGLGLSISKGISEDHHGTLTYDEKSLHTAFVLKLPAKQA